MVIDERIKDINLIGNPFNSEDFKSYIGKNCYVSSRMNAFWNLDLCNVKTLKKINTLAECPYIDNFGYPWDFCLPVELVKKIRRPYTLEEFIKNVGDVGACVRYRIKDDPEVYRSVITEIREKSGFVVIGNLMVSTERLFNEFEYYNGEVWVPFGVEKWDWTQEF